MQVLERISSIPDMLFVSSAVQQQSDFPLVIRVNHCPHQYINPSFACWFWGTRCPEWPMAITTSSPMDLLCFLVEALLPLGVRPLDQRSPRMTGWEASIFPAANQGHSEWICEFWLWELSHHILQAGLKHTAHPRAHCPGPARSFHLDSGVLFKRPSHHLLRPAVSGLRGKWQN